MQRTVVVCDIDGTITFSFIDELHITLKAEGYAVNKAAYSMDVPRDVLAEVHDRLIAQGVLAKCELDEGVSETLWRIHEHHDLVYVTARGAYSGEGPLTQQAVEDTRGMLQRCNVPQYSNLVFAQDKGQVCVQKAAVAIIEDYHVNLDQVHQYASMQGHEIQKFLIAQEHNRDHQLIPGSFIELSRFADISHHLPIVGKTKQQVLS